MIAFGFGRKTGSELPGELDGIVRPRHKWDAYSIGSIPMGQELAVTPIQLITAHAALANSGRLCRPTLIATSDDQQREQIGAVADLETAALVSGTVDPRIAEWLVTEPMTEVVRRGTGTKAQLRDYDVFGKTGTAQKLDPKTGGYSENRYVCSFICGAPSADPRVLVLVTVDAPTVGSPHYGGTVAAPAASRILQQSLQQMKVPSRRLAGAKQRARE